MSDLDFYHNAFEKFNKMYFDEFFAKGNPVSKIWHLIKPDMKVDAMFEGTKDKKPL
jgi:hypothetical protein